MLELKLGKIPVKLRFSFLLCVSLFLLLERLEMGRKLLLAILLHECGHLIVLLLTGQKPASVELSMGGISILRRAQSQSFRQELLLHSAGPLSNLLFVALLWERDKFSCAFHLILAAVNLLPLPNLDGGSITELILEQLLPPEKVPIFCRRIAGVTMFVLLIAAIPLFFREKNPALLLFLIQLLLQKK